MLNEFMNKYCKIEHDKQMTDPVKKWIPGQIELTFGVHYNKEIASEIHHQTSLMKAMPVIIQIWWLITLIMDTI